MTVVSGMALGIDTCAHEGSLQEKGKTAAVLACGLDICYPAQNHVLKKKIEENGILLSEYPPGDAGTAIFFSAVEPDHQRTVAFNCGDPGGNRWSSDYGGDGGGSGQRRCGGAGNIDSEYNLGSNKLIREGALVLTGVQDLLEAAGLSSLPEQEAKRLLGDEEQQLYDLLCSHGLVFGSVRRFI